VAELGTFSPPPCGPASSPTHTGPVVRVEPLHGDRAGHTIVAVLCSIVLVGFPLRVLPFARPTAPPEVHVDGDHLDRRSFHPRLGAVELSGYEDKGKPVTTSTPPS